MSIVTGNYNEPVPEYGDLLTVSEYLSMVNNGFFIDYDGFGHPYLNGMMDGELIISPSGGSFSIPFDATHIIWFNR